LSIEFPGLFQAEPAMGRALPEGLIRKNI